MFPIFVARANYPAVAFAKTSIPKREADMPSRYRRGVKAKEYKMDLIDEARQLLARNGRKAQQIIVDEIVAAIRQGDNDDAVRRGAVLREMERLISAATP
jgi:hypothetical protein